MRARPTICLLLCVVALATVCVSVPATGAVGGDREVPRGTWPLAPKPEVVRRFDPPDSPYGRGHRGVDLLGHPGQAVHSALAGTVAFVGVIAGRGVVTVSHGGLRTTYEPVTATVAVGDQVGEGGVIGRLAPGHSHCRPRQCLHWGLRRGDTYLDPLLIVGGGPVRLLPLSGVRTRTGSGSGGLPPLLAGVRGSRRPDQLTVALSAFTPWSWAGV